jgi:hypothetical protein
MRQVMIHVLCEEIVDGALDIRDIINWFRSSPRSVHFPEIIAVAPVVHNLQRVSLILDRRRLITDLHNPEVGSVFVEFLIK